MVGYTLCIQIPLHTVMNFVVKLPIYQFYREAERNWGSRSHLYLWNQPMELDETSAEAEHRLTSMTVDDLCTPMNGRS